MKNIPRKLAIALIVVLTTISGYMQGTMKRRWGAFEFEKIAVARLHEFPKNLGTWETFQEGELNDAAIHLLQPLGYLVRTLKSPTTSSPISMTLLIGPPGPTGAHTPEVCVSGIGYEKLGLTEKLTVSHPDHPEFEGTFWVASFRSKGYDRHILREYWAWSTGGPWEAAPSARMGYARFPYLYKIQMGCRLPAGSDIASDDPVVDLLHFVLAESPNYLLTENEATAMATESTETDAEMPN